jgi:hypothetical protein
MSRPRVLMLSLALAAGSAFTFTAVAPAGDVATFNTHLIMRQTAPAFHGRVKSDSDLCIDNRKVKLYRRKRAGRPKHLLGTDRSDSAGRWAVLEDQFTLRSGIYFAITRRILDESTALPTFCERDKSRKIVVD